MSVQSTSHLFSQRCPNKNPVKKARAKLAESLIMHVQFCSKIAKGRGGPGGWSTQGQTHHRPHPHPRSNSGDIIMSLQLPPESGT